jgi:Protein of unknown function (DUF3109).
VGDHQGYETLYYHHWSICSPACAYGQTTGLRVYQFVRQPLIRHFGEAFYRELDEAADAYLEAPST